MAFLMKTTEFFKHQYLSTKGHDFTSQNPVIFIVIVLRILNLIHFIILCKYDLRYELIFETRDGAWIGNRIYCTLTTQDYMEL
jgi:hypothetical protein